MGFIFHGTMAVGRLGLLLALHWGIPHDLLDARLIHGELRQMLFSRYARRRHLRKLNAS
jgi:hypothetical protein